MQVHWDLYKIMELWWWLCVPISVMFVMCWLPTPLRYQIRFIIFMLYTFISTIIFVPFMLHRPRDSRNGLMPAWAVRWCSRLFLGLTFEVRGQENILPQGQGCVVVVNHQSSLDIIGHGLIEFLPAIPTVGKSVTEVIEETREEMQKAFTRLSAEAVRRSEKPPIN
ncbi:hypothetical protein B566_EDAN006315 [Ephemera danica]|nr:hypothetical protein B566_EDAN006315 [Ephemera danica]